MLSFSIGCLEKIGVTAWHCVDAGVGVVLPVFAVCWRANVTSHINDELIFKPDLEDIEFRVMSGQGEMDRQTIHKVGDHLEADDERELYGPER